VPKRTVVVIEVETPDWWSPIEIAQEVAIQLADDGFGIKSVRLGEPGA
jgi:hypothetical protein